MIRKPISFEVFDVPLLWPADILSATSSSRCFQTARGERSDRYDRGENALVSETRSQWRSRLYKYSRIFSHRFVFFVFQGLENEVISSWNRTRSTCWKQRNIYYWDDIFDTCFFPLVQYVELSCLLFIWISIILKLDVVNDWLSSKRFDYLSPSIMTHMLFFTYSLIGCSVAGIAEIRERRAYS